MPDPFHDFTLNVLSKALDADSINQVLIANNIANVDTPGYKRMELSFKDQLRSFLNNSDTLKGTVTHPDDIPIGGPSSLEEIEPRVTVDNNTTMRADQNNVDIDREMALLSQNSLEYQALSSLVVSKLTMLRIAINGQ